MAIGFSFGKRLRGVALAALVLLASPALASPALATNPFKVNVAVLDLTGNPQEFSADELRTVTSRFETELMKLDVYQVLERRDMSLILQEQDFQGSDLCNTSECQVQLGQLLGVERILSGSVSKVGNLITLNVKMVDVGSGRNLLSHALDIRGNMETVLRGGCFELAQIFAGKKKPSNDHTVLAAERPLWPWIAGATALVAGGVVAVLVLTADEEPSSYDVNTGF